MQIEFVNLARVLYRRSVNGSLDICLSEGGSYLAQSKIHEGLCGAHQAGDKMKWVLQRQGYYWTTIVRDCILFAKSSKECQKHGHIQNVPASELLFIVKHWPFRG